MNLRDRTGEILEVKERNPLRHRFGSHSLSDLKSHWLITGKKEGSTPDFYVIRTVTLLEVFTRGNIAELIDHAPVYASRAIELSKNLKMDFALVQGIQGRAITLGDIVAHNVSVNSFGQMLGHFEILLDKKPLRPLLTGAVDRWSIEIEKKPSEPIIPDFDVLAGTVTRLFEVRHILCHESPKKPVYVVAEVEKFLSEAIRFTKAIEEILTFEMFGLVPLTQTAMNVTAAEDLRKKEQELDRILNEVRAIVKASDNASGGLNAENDKESWLHSLNDVYKKWLSYRDAQCDFDTYSHQGGTIRPTLWASEASRLTESHIAELRSWLKRESEN